MIVQFYLLAPVLALLFAIRKPAFRRSVIVAAIVATSVSFPWTDLTAARYNSLIWMAHLSLAGNIQYFLTGFLLAEFFLLFPPARYCNRGWDILTLIGWPLLAFMLMVAPQITFITLPAIVLALYVAAFYGNFSSSAFASLWVASIGGMCYSIYLLHNYAIAAIGFVTERFAHTYPFGIRLAVQAVLITPWYSVLVYFSTLRSSSPACDRAGQSA
jgi:peptidoglycan/LPS O-acetylase OafA/YrhL